MTIAWLNDSRNPRTLVCEAQARQKNGTLKTHRWSTRAFQTKPTDPAQASYLCVITGEPVIAASADNELDIGGIDLVNMGELDSALLDDFALQTVTLALGDAAWARAAFVDIDLVADENGLVGGGYNALKLALRSPLARLDTPVSIEKTPNEKIVPVGFGSCFNLAPVFLGEDINGAHYQVNDGAVVSIDVKSGGLALAGVTLDLPNGKFSVDPPPTGEVTADVVFSTADSVPEIIAAMLTRAGMAYDAANLSAWQTQCPMQVGFYIDSNVSYREAIEQVGESVGLRLGAFPAGIAQLWRIGEPIEGTQVLNVGTGNMPLDTFEFGRKILPYAVVRLGYRKNWNPLEKSALFGTGEDLNFIDLYGREWSAVTVTDTAIDAEYPAAARMPDGDVTETALQLQADAVNEAIRRFQTFGVALYEFKLSLALDFLYPLGSVLKITDARYGFAEGGLAQVVDVRWMPLSGVSELTVWVWK